MTRMAGGEFLSPKTCARTMGWLGQRFAASRNSACLTTARILPAVRRPQPSPLQGNDPSVCGFLNLDDLALGLTSIGIKINNC